MPNVLWAYKTTLKRSIGESPFSMFCGTETVIPLEVDLPTMRINSFSPGSNDQILAEQLDLIEENRDIALIWLANYQQRLCRRYNRNVRPREFVPRDLVIGKNKKYKGS